MKRLLLLTFIFALVVFIPIVIWQGWLEFVNKQESLLVTIILSLLELFGIIIVISAVYQSVLYRRPRRFVFDGFSNASEFATAQKQPIDLNSLAREELVLQFQIIYSVLQKYANDWITKNSPGSPQGSSFSNFPLDTDVNTPLFTKKDLYSEGDPTIKMQNYLPTLGGYASNISLEIYSVLIKQLNQIMKSFEDHNNPFTIANTIGGSVPKEIALFLNFIDAVIPPKLIKASGHLQYRRSQSERVGITIETTDLNTQQTSVSRTIWQPEPNDASTQSLAESYIELLSPVMRWLVLMFWEQEVEPKLRFGSFGGKFFTHQQLHARFLYLLGSLYYGSAKQFPKYSHFFNQLAVEHLLRASNEDRNCWLPGFYQASIYSNEMQQFTGKMKESLFHEALDLYKEVLSRSNNEDVKYRKNIQKRIMIDEAAMKLRSGDRDFIEEARKHLDNVQATEKLDGLVFPNDPERSALYLYTLACCYGIAIKNGIRIANAQKFTQRYCAYVLARDPELLSAVEEDRDLECIHTANGLEKLRKLQRKLKDKPDLSRKEGKTFIQTIDIILREIGWEGAANLTTDDRAQQLDFLKHLHLPKQRS